MICIILSNTRLRFVIAITVSFCRMYFQTLIKSLDCSHDDRQALFTLCLFHSLIKNQGEISP